MLALLAKLGMTLAGDVVGIFSASGKAKAEATAQRIQSMGRSWTDEFIVLVFFFPIIVSWFSPTRAAEYYAAFDSMPEWYAALIIGITAAVFGLGKLQGPSK
jgi:hypothetical protein